MALRPAKIHQFSHSVSVGDGVTNSLFYIRKLLRGLGYDSDIYAGDIPPELIGEVRPLREYRDNAEQVLLVHHCLGHDHEEWLMARPDFKVLVYHNITPAEYFPPDSELHYYCNLGRRQLKAWAARFPGAIGLSEYNAEELVAAGYGRVAVIPLLVDIDRLVAEPWDATIPERYPDTHNLVFVGRVVEHKCQHQIIDMFEAFTAMTDQPSRLFLVGGIASGSYEALLRERITAAGLTDRVILTGKVSNAELFGYYRAADVFVSMSEHEGFGIPLIEAMLFDVPVVAYNSSNIGNTLGSGGLCFSEKNISAMAAAVKLLRDEPLQRRRVIQGQRANLKRFSVPVLIRQLAAHFAELGVELNPVHPGGDVLAPGREILIEGPFDSSYSLAIVNRETSRALQRQRVDVGLYSTEGPGDFEPDPAFLKAHPDVDALWRKGREDRNPEVVLRNLYPPRVEGMRGVTHVLSGYGWEESSFPAAWVRQFNRRLHLITTTSRFVEKVLRDNGARVPVVTIGNGADHLLAVERKPLDCDLGTGFRFLHVSSCFPRKGVDVLLRAYARAFTARDEVVLVIKTFPNPHNDVEWRIARLREQYPECPAIVLINRDIEEGQLVDLYQSCQAFVAPSRGEGFNLPAAEAMLFELPLVITGHGGQMDFCDAKNSWLIDYRYAPAASHLGLFGSVWAEPDESHLAELLKEVYAASPDVRRRRTSRAKTRVSREYTWDRVAARLRAAIRGLDERPAAADHALRVGWVTTWNCRCGIASYSEWFTRFMPPGQLTLLANRNVERQEPDGGNVARCWESGHSDPLDELYATSLDRKLDAVVIQFNFGFFSLRSLGRLIVRLRRRGIDSHVFFHSTADVDKPDFKASLGTIVAELRQAERLYVHTVADLNRLKEFGLVENVVLFPHGVYAPLPADRIALRDDLGLAGRRVVASYGYLLPHKGIPQLIQAFTQLQARHGDLHLLLINALYPVGESAAERESCRELIQKSGCASRITMVNDYLADDEALACLSLADLIVYPYQNTEESASGAVRMGLASLRPVACTPLRIFEDVGEAVHRLPGTRVEDLANGIEDLLLNGNKLLSLAERQRDYVNAHQWPLLAERLWNILNYPDGDVASVSDRAGSARAAG